MQRDFNTYLQDIIDAIQKIEKYTKNFSFENFLIDELIQDGVLKNLIIIGEAVKNIPEDIKIINSEIEWKKIAGLRDILINKDFRKLSRYSMQIPLKIKYIHIDYYLIHSSKRSQYKFGRGYQSKDSILILVPLNIKKSKNTQFKNIKIFSVYDFCDFIGFSDEIRREFIHFARLALGSIRDTKDILKKLSKLEQKADQCENELKTNPKINFSI